MKKLHVLFYLVLVICVVGTGVFIALSPDLIPVHYNFAGEVDRIGSKYENIIFPIITMGMALFILLMAKLQRKKGETSTEKMLMLTGLSLVSFFTLMGFYFMWKGLVFESGKAQAHSLGEVNRFVNIGLGALLIMLGNMMPKMRKNAFFGLRTKWSMANNSVWQKSQRFSCITSVIAGFFIIILSLFLSGLWSYLIISSIILSWILICVIASYRYYLSDKAIPKKFPQ